MKRILAAAAIVVSLAPSAVRAQERAGSAALGALSGALVLGPVGAVAGAVVGYTAGPAIARSWGLGQSEPPSPQRVVRPQPKQARSAQATPMPRSSPQRAAPEALLPPRPPSQAADATKALPPVQGFE
jgi:hypothetical protein